MFAFGNFLLATLAFVLIGQVMARPISMPMPMQRAVEERRQLAPLDTIPAYVKRQTLNDFPVEQASKSDGTKIVPYSKRQDINTLPEQVPSTAPDGNIKQYGTRQNLDVNTFRADIPSAAPDGEIVAYESIQPKKRQNSGLDINTFRADVPSAAPDGEIVAYETAKLTKREPAVNDFPAQLASKSSGDGNIVAYDSNQTRDEVNVAKRWEEGIPSEIAVRSANGVIELY